MIEFPDVSVDVTAGVEPGAVPGVTTKIWKAGPPVGAGAHWKAHPMFQVPPAMVKVGLVQLPDWVVWGTSTVAGPTAGGAVVAVVPPATVVVVAPAAAVVVGDEAPAAVVVGEAPVGGGSL